jgi:hypothetical protein
MEAASAKELQAANEMKKKEEVAKAAAESFLKKQQQIELSRQEELVASRKRTARLEEERKERHATQAATARREAIAWEAREKAREDEQLEKERQFFNASYNHPYNTSRRAVSPTPKS